MPGLVPDSPIRPARPGAACADRRLRGVIEAKDAELAGLRSGFAAIRADLEAELELRRRLELPVELRLGMDSSDSGDAELEGADRGEGAQEGAEARAPVLGAGAPQRPQSGGLPRAAWRGPVPRPGS